MANSALATELLLIKWLVSIENPNANEVVGIKKEPTITKKLLAKIVKVYTETETKAPKPPAKSAKKLAWLEYFWNHVVKLTALNSTVFDSGQVISITATETLSANSDWIDFVCPVGYEYNTSNSANTRSKKASAKRWNLPVIKLTKPGTSAANANQVVGYFFPLEHPLSEKSVASDACNWNARKSYEDIDDVPPPAYSTISHTWNVLWKKVHPLPLVAASARGMMEVGESATQDTIDFHSWCGSQDEMTMNTVTLSIILKAIEEYDLRDKRGIYIGKSTEEQFSICVTIGAFSSYRLRVKLDKDGVRLGTTGVVLTTKDFDFPDADCNGNHYEFQSPNCGETTDFLKATKKVRELAPHLFVQHALLQSVFVVVCENSTRKIMVCLHCQRIDPLPIGEPRWPEEVGGIPTFVTCGFVQSIGTMESGMNIHPQSGDKPSTAVGTFGGYVNHDGKVVGVTAAHVLYMSTSEPQETPDTITVSKPVYYYHPYHGFVKIGDRKITELGSTIDAALIIDLTEESLSKSPHIFPGSMFKGYESIQGAYFKIKITCIHTLFFIESVNCLLAGGKPAEPVELYTSKFDEAARDFLSEWNQGVLIRDVCTTETCLGMTVFKKGYKTGLTVGKVISINALCAEYCNGKAIGDGHRKLYQGQIIVKPIEMTSDQTKLHFCEQGDSGSLVFSKPEKLENVMQSCEFATNIVGVLHRQLEMSELNLSFGIACPAKTVETTLDVSFCRVNLAAP